MDNSKHFTFNITSGAILKVLSFAILFAALYYMRDLVLVVLTAVVIASAIEPVILFFKKYKINRLLSVILVYLIFVIFVAGASYIFLPTLIADVSNFLTSLPQYIDKISLWNPLKEDIFSQNNSVVKELGLGQPLSLRELGVTFSESLNNPQEAILNTLSSIFGGFLSLVLIAVLSFYLAVQEDGVAIFLRIITPLKYEKYVIGLWKRSQLKIGLWMQGQILLGAIVAILVYLGLMIIGVPNALLLALLSFVFEIIPVFGPILAAIPAVLMGLSSGLSVGLFVLGLYLIIQQFENHLIYPLVVKKIVGIPPIMVILALIIGAKLAGFLGIILSVPIASVIVEYIDDIQKDKLAKVVKDSA